MNTTGKIIGRLGGKILVTALDAFVKIIGFGLVVVEGNGDKGAVKGINSTQTVLHMTDPVTDVVITTSDEVENGLFAPVFEVLHIGELQTDRFFDLTDLVGPNRENPN